ERDEGGQMPRPPVQPDDDQIYQPDHRQRRPREVRQRVDGLLQNLFHEMTWPPFDAPHAPAAPGPMRWFKHGTTRPRKQGIFGKSPAHSRSAPQDRARTTRLSPRNNRPLKMSSSPWSSVRLRPAAPPITSVRSVIWASTSSMRRVMGLSGSSLRKRRATAGATARKTRAARDSRMSPNGVLRVYAPWRSGSFGGSGRPYRASNAPAVNVLRPRKSKYSTGAAEPSTMGFARRPAGSSAPAAASGPADTTRTSPVRRMSRDEAPTRIS